MTQALARRNSILTPATFEEGIRAADVLSKSKMVPDMYQGPTGHANCLIALEMAGRLGMGVIEVMQSLYIVKGKPSWSAQFVIALVGASGEFTPLSWKSGGTGDSLWWQAIATRVADEYECVGPMVTIAMAKAEGWGAKWKSMPDVMGRYRAASFWARIYAPHLLLGMHTDAELEDVAVATAQSSAPLSKGDGMDWERYTNETKSVIERMERDDATREQLERLTAQLTAKAKAMGAPDDWDARKWDDRVRGAWIAFEKAERQGFEEQI